MSNSFKCEDYMNKRVVIKSTNKASYLSKGLIGMYGTVTNACEHEVGVRIDGVNNSYSGTGVFWFTPKDVKLVNNESEENVMEGFKYVAIVNLLEDYSKKDYAFALYEDDYRMISFVEAVRSPAMVVVNARQKNNRLLATVKKIIPVEEYNGTKITAEVVGVVDMNRFIRREEEKIRLEELAKKRAAIEAELEKEINKRKSVEYYEEMAKKYSDNPRLAELVCELRILGA